MKRTYQPKKRHRKWSTASERECLTEMAARFSLAAEQKAESSFLINFCTLDERID